ncbi:DsbA family protein [Vaginisenegalia massiliensis]|uniref:DsbA family protein n=1 Tax=Vaginisenegalia massiliensis TaxID=2058294 RepID=UPI000F525AF7|nr:DsbA family protein [Vaginisenegalia massiliensis]
MMNSYQVDYHTNGVSKVFEFYLFVNPLGRICYYSQQEMMNAVDRISSKTDIHILCFHNQRTVVDFMKQLKIPSHDLATRNKIYNVIYNASLAYKAACMQGKKKGRLFLLKMQQQLDLQIDRYNDEFVLDIAKEVGLDIDMFLIDRSSAFIKQLHLNDQKIATDMKVQATPTLVLFEHSASQSGLVIEDHITQDLIFDQLDYMTQADFDSYPGYSPEMQVIKRQPHLRLLP